MTAAIRRVGLRDEVLIATRGLVDAPVGLVWSVFVDVDRWVDWTDTMRVWFRRTGVMEAGSELAFELDQEVSKTFNQALVVEFIPPVRLAWSVESSGSQRGYHSLSTWTFTPAARRSPDGFALALPSATRVVNLRTLERHHTTTTNRSEVLVDSTRLLHRFIDHLDAECRRRVAVPAAGDGMWAHEGPR